MRGICTSLTLCALLVAAGAVTPARASAAGVRSGTYHCIVGFSTMLTYGDITISGRSFRFKAPDGTGGSGSFAAGPQGSLRWRGSLGTITRPPYHIVQSGIEPYVKDSFWFKFGTSASSTQTMSCRRL